MLLYHTVSIKSSAVVCVYNAYQKSLMWKVVIFRYKLLTKSSAEVLLSFSHMRSLQVQFLNFQNEELVVNH